MANKRANAFEAGRAPGSYRVSGRSVATASRASGVARTSKIASKSAANSLTLDAEKLIRFFPGSLAEPSIGKRILLMANTIFSFTEAGGECRDGWEDFLADTELLEKHSISAEEIAALRSFAPFGMLTGSDDILFILDRIRLARRPQ
jgi:hypothetical protein